MPRRNTIQIEINAQDNASGVLGKVGGAISKLGGIAAGLGTAAVAGIAGLGAAIGKLTIDAAATEGVSRAFDGLTKDMEGGSGRMLSALQKASGGMIDQASLMRSFNKAAQLVSTDFAKKLPDAMGSLGKVAAATGQDMGFLMDSLVTGVGRLSPMILDNLAIQVDATQAYEDYAKSIGKSTGALTKQEQQMALMNQVVTKLAENTANMPDVTESAAAQMQKFKTQLKDAGMAIGTTFLPLLNQLLSRALPVLEKILPRIVKAFETFGYILSAGNIPDILYRLADAFEDIIPPGLAGALYGLAKAYAIVRDAITEGISLPDILYRIADAFEDVFSPQLNSLIYGIADALGAFITAISERDILGALSALASAFGELWTFVQPYLAQLWKNFSTWFMAQDWGAHAQTAMTTLGQAFSTIWEFVQPHLATLWTGFTTWVASVDWVSLGTQIIQHIVTGLAQFAILTVEMFNGWALAFQTWAATVDWYTVGFTVVTAILEGLAAFIEFVGETVSTWYTAISEGTAGLDWGSIGSSIIEGIKSGIVAMASSLANAAVNAAKGAWDAVMTFIGAHSPSKLFADTVGKSIAEGMGMGIMDNANVPVSALRGVVGGMMQAGNTYNFNQTVNTAATTATVAQDFQTMAAMSGAAI